MRHLSAREYSRAELARKLAPHAPDGDTLEQLLEDLERRGFLSDERYVESVLHRRATRMGAARVKQELQAKGVDPERIRSAIAQLQPNEYERARAVWAQRFGTPALDAKEQARQMRFLLARGFASDVVRRIVRGPHDDDTAC